jgi:hypothetical protein
VNFTPSSTALPSFPELAGVALGPKSEHGQVTGVLVAVGGNAVLVGVLVAVGGNAVPVGVLVAVDDPGGFVAVAVAGVPVAVEDGGVLVAVLVGVPVAVALPAGTLYVA